MVLIQRGRMKRKATGGKYKPCVAKQKHEKAGTPTMTKIGEQKTKLVRGRGGNSKTKIFVAKIANILDPKSKKYTKSTIKTVIESPANRHYVRRNIIVKGTIIETEAGKAKVTSRPGQDGTVNAVLV